MTSIIRLNCSFLYSVKNNNTTNKVFVNSKATNSAHQILASIALIAVLLVPSVTVYSCGKKWFLPQMSGIHNMQTISHYSVGSFYSAVAGRIIHPVILNPAAELFELNRESSESSNVIKFCGRLLTLLIQNV